MRQLALMAALLAPLAAFAQAKDDDAAAERAKRAKADDSKDFLRLAMNFYDQQDGGGNPDVDEDMQVLEPQLLVGFAVTDRLSFTVKAHGGVVSAASTNSGARGRTSGTTGGGGGGGGGEDEDEDEDDGAVSGASAGGGEKEGTSLADGDPFFGIEPAAFYAWSDAVGTGVGVTYGQEPSYRSIGGNARLVLTTPAKNDTFTIHGSATFDTVQVRRFDGTGAGDKSRNTFSGGVAWTHILTPKTVTSVSYDITWQHGLLSTPYNSVLVDGTEVTEELPGTRLRHALYGRLRHLLVGDLAVEPGVVLYADDWGVLAASPELRASWEIAPGVLILQPSYRFHWQREVDYFTGRSETSVPEYRTQDSDLSSFTSHSLGLKLVFPDITIFGASTELELGGDYTFRSTRLNGFSLTAGFKGRF